MFIRIAVIESQYGNRIVGHFIDVSTGEQFQHSIFQNNSFYA